MLITLSIVFFFCHVFIVGLLCMVIGVFLTLCLEQISMHLLQEKETVLRKSVAADKSPLLSLLSSESNVIDAYRAESRSSAPSSSTPTLHPAISEFEVQFYETIRTSHLQKSLVKGILLEVSVAIHSIIIGFDLGSLDSQATLEILMVAFAFHQFFEGISLGTALSETHLPSWVKFLFALNFALTFPLGVIIGMLASSSADTSTVEIIQGCANGIASGSLIYTALVEMISEDFAEESLLSRWHVKGQMMLAVAFGVAGMAILAVWA